MTQYINIMRQNLWQMRYYKISRFDTFIYFGGCANIKMLLNHFVDSHHKDKMVPLTSYNISYRWLSARLQYLYCISNI